MKAVTLLTPEPGNWEVPKKPAAGFRHPYTFHTTTRLMRPPPRPRIEISLEALVRMYLYVNNIGLEVGWLGTVEEVVPSKWYRIDNVYMFEQSIGSGHMDITSDSLFNFISGLAGHPQEDFIFNNTRFWGHSHVEGGIFPSDQDERQMDIFGELNSPWFLRGILNRKGIIDFTFFDWARGLIFDSVPWTVEYVKKIDREWVQQLRVEVMTEMKQLVTKRPAPPLPAGYYGNYNPLAVQDFSAVTTIGTATSKVTPPATPTENMWGELFNILNTHEENDDWQPNV